MLRQLPPERKNGVAPAYRLSVTCDSERRTGEMRLSWAPSPTTGVLLVSSDGAAPTKHAVEGMETNGNGSPGSAPPSSIAFVETQPAMKTRVPLPTQSLRVNGLFPGEAPEFSFTDLSPAARTALAACFSTAGAR